MTSISRYLEKDLFETQPQSKDNRGILGFARRYLAKPLTLIAMASALSSTPRISQPSYAQAQQPSKVVMRVFHDYNGNGEFNQDKGEYLISGVKIRAGDKSCESDEEGFCVIDGLQKNRHNISIDAPKKFTYILPSKDEIFSLEENGFYIDLENEAPKNIPLAEGFLTLPFKHGTNYFVGIDYTKGRFYDRDPNPSTYLWWNGRRGQETYSGPGANHVGTDFGANADVPVVAAAPGIVLWVGRGAYGEIGVQIAHPNGMDTTYLHLSKFIVSKGQKISRGDIIGYNGSTGATYPHVHLDLFYRTREGPLLVDPFRVVVDVVGGSWLLKDGKLNWIVIPNDHRNKINYWTKDNDPKFP